MYALNTWQWLQFPVFWGILCKNGSMLPRFCVVLFRRNVIVFAFADMSVIAIGGIFLGTGRGN